MMKARAQALKYSFTEIFNTRDDMAKGRVINLALTFLAAIYNVFITGIFYTGFLTMNGIDISGSGIVSMIPLIANMFTIFSSKVLGRFKNRKRAMLGATVYFYFMYIIATTLMPTFVTDPHLRLICFCVILFMAYAVYSPFSPGITVWFYQFYPKDNERRTRYLLYCSIMSSIMSTIVLLTSGLVADALNRSGKQELIITIFRYVAFALVMVAVIIQRNAKDFSPPEQGNLSLREVFTEPLKHKKFRLCLIMMFFWNYVANLNNGLWNYHLLNHMHFEYTLINSMSILYTFFLLTGSGLWRRVLRRYSWIRTFAITCVCWIPTEIIYFFMTPERSYIYVPMCVMQQFLAVGMNLSYSNILYMNLPEEHSTSAIACYTIGCNLCAFFGLMTGTYVASITGDTPVYMFGMNLYSVQFTTLMRAVAIAATGVLLLIKWKSFTNDADIEAIERDEAARKALSARRPKMTVKSAVSALKRKIGKA